MPTVLISGTPSPNLNSTPQPDLNQQTRPFTKRPPASLSHTTPPPVDPATHSCTRRRSHTTHVATLQAPKMEKTV
ncbi:hypothetical protein Pyn_07931 [Prunus yedoensis var. nudiflora]|uniref:Uncharacterized protein n=1 Tax=Prunus yedoensis var. nudiflora TaxID=2094558 RepID=A0A314Z9M0_PRUYE|nr:hypothetical protein Pyn_07931 [Prunus yedoensis var. nudiflora]